MSIISDHQNGAAMKKVLASMGWVAAGLIGALIFYAYPDYRIHIEIILGIIFGYRLLDELLESAVRRVLWDEFLELRRQSHANTDRLEDIDRKVSAILSDALERRRRPGT
jgi:hypothetical protein